MRIFGFFLLACSFFVASCAQDDANLTLDDASLEVADFNYVIPAGSGELIDAGEVLDILPQRLEAKVGQIIHIANEDDRGHLVGPFFIGAHEELSQRFSSPGELSGECSVHPSGQFVVSVTE